MAQESAHDVRVDNHGSIFIVTPCSPAGSEWVDDNLPTEAQRWGANGVVVEHRYITPIVEGMLSDGLAVA